MGPSNPAFIVFVSALPQPRHGVPSSAHALFQSACRSLPPAFAASSLPITCSFFFLYCRMHSFLPKGNQQPRGQKQEEKNQLPACWRHPQPTPPQTQPVRAQAVSSTSSQHHRECSTGQPSPVPLPSLELPRKESTRQKALRGPFGACYKGERGWMAF